MTNNLSMRQVCSALAVFNFLFAWSYIVDLSGTVSKYSYLVSFSSFSLFSLFKLALVFVAGSVIIKPSSIRRSITLFVFLLIYTFIKLPRMPNHSVFAAIVMITILCAYLFSRIKYKNEFTQTRFYETFAPAVRLQVIILYFWAAFHKINTGFFEEQISCATIQIFNLQNTLPFLPAPEAFIKSNPYITLIIESAIPILLFINSTRIYGLIVGILFHFILGFRYPGFTILVYAFLSLFILPSSYDAMKSDFNRIKDKLLDKISSYSNYSSWSKSGVDRYILHFIWVCLLLYIVHFFMRGSSKNYFLISRVGLYLILCVGVMTAFSYFVLRRLKHLGIDNKIRLMPLNMIFIFFPMLIFFNGLSPHLGLKNIQALAMFSNLRTGGGTTNHYLIPPSFQVFDNLKELVTIKGSNIKIINQFSGYTSKRPIPGTNVKLPQPYLDYLEEKGQDIEKRYEYKVPIELLRDIVTVLKKRGAKDIKIEYEKENGEVVYTRNAENEPELTGSSLLKIKLLNLRAVPNDERGLCMW